MTEKDSMMLGMDSEKLDNILNYVVESYKNSKFLVNLSTTGYKFAMHPDTKEKLCEEFHLTEEDFGSLMSEIMLFVMSLVMDTEDRIFAKYGKTEEVVKALNIFKLKSKNLIEYLRFKLFCKTRYLEDLSWDVSIRVRQKGGIKMQFPLSVIRMRFSEAGSLLPTILGEENTVTFECTLRDVEEMIQSLEEIKSALKEIQEEV